MQYNFNPTSNIVDYDIKEYKNGYFLGLIGANKSVRIFIIKNLMVQYLNYVIKLKYNYSLELLNFYLEKKYYSNFFNNKKLLVQNLNNLLAVRLLNLIWQYKSFLWFKGRNFLSNLNKNTLFINNGRIKHLQFKKLSTFDWIFSRKSRYLGIKSNSYIFLHIYLNLIHKSYKPNIYTGKGIRLRGIYLKKKIGKRKIY